MKKKLILGIATIIAILLIVSASVYIVQHPTHRPLPSAPAMRLALGFGLAAIVLGYSMYDEKQHTVCLTKVTKVFSIAMVLDGVILIVGAPFL